MSYQIFGDNENIFGYKNLCVKVYYSCGKLNIYVGLKYDSVLKKDQTDGIDPDDVIKSISSKYQTNVCYNLNEFSLDLSKEKSFTPYGKLENEFQVEAKSGDELRKREFQIYKAHCSDPGFIAYHERMQTFLLWYIEAASFIDIDDDRWDFFVLYEKLPLATTGSEFQYCFVGYATVYRYYAYPNNVRPRISQFIVLPPFQRIKLGTKLLETIYAHYNNTSTVSITVEDPSETFQRMRDILDCRMCMKLDTFGPEMLQKGWSKEMAENAEKQFKLPGKQARRVYEILRLKHTDRSRPEQYRAYRLVIKQRLDAPYHKQIQDVERLRKKKFITESNYAALMKANQRPQEYRTKLLAKDYAAIETEYMEIIEKL